MRYELFGRLRLHAEHDSYTIGARKMEAILAALLVRRGRIVSIGQLSAEIWGSDPPRRATETLHVYVSQLRKFISRPGWCGSCITTSSPGYVFELGDDELDVRDFERLVNQGRDLARIENHAAATSALQAALDMWSEPLCDARNGPIVHEYATWLGELRLDCIDMLVSSSLALGRHHQLIGMLRTLVSEYPLHEEFYRYLMLALRRADRRAEALAVYQAARDTTMRELGLEPCPALRELQRSILAGEDDAPALDPRKVAL